MARKKPKGWVKEPVRHGLAAKGIKTSSLKNDRKKEFEFLGRAILEPMIVRLGKQDFPDMRITRESAPKEIPKVIRAAFSHFAGKRMPPSVSIVVEENRLFRYKVNKKGNGKVEGRFVMFVGKEKHAVGAVSVRVRNRKIRRMTIWIGPGPTRLQPTFEETFAKELVQIRVGAEDA